MDFAKEKCMPVECETHLFNEVTYLVDYLEVKALVIISKNRKDIERIVIYLKGGKGQVGRVRTARLMQFTNEYTLAIGPYCRGSNGSKRRDEFYCGDLNDVTRLIRLLDQNYPSAFIYMVGFSRGGPQGLLTFNNLPVDSYIIWGGVFDMHLMYEERVGSRGILRQMVGHPKKDAKAYGSKDAMQFIRKDSPPVLITRGGKDIQVGIYQSYGLGKELESKGVYYQTYYQLDGGHVPRLPAMRDVVRYIRQ